MIGKPRVVLVLAEVGTVTRQEVVKDDDLPVVFEQPVDEVAPDEPQAAGDKGLLIEEGRRTVVINEQPARLSFHSDRPD